MKIMKKIILMLNCFILYIDWNSGHRLCGFDAVFSKVWILLVFPDCDRSLMDSESLFTK